jgi:uncharacterized membrane protein
MKTIDPKMERLINSQLKAVFVNAILAIIISFTAVFTNYSFDFVPLFGAMVMTFIVSKILNFISLTFLKMKIYGSDVDKMVADAEFASGVLGQVTEEETEGPQTVELQLTIVDTPEKPYGKYMDTDFFEWLDIRGITEKVERCTYVGIADIKNIKAIPPGQIVLPPGLIYQVETI